MIIEFYGCCAYSRARIIDKEHHTSRLGKAFWEEVSQPESIALCPGFTSMVRSTFEVEAVDCHNTGEQAIREVPKEGGKGEIRTRSLALCELDRRSSCRRGYEAQEFVTFRYVCRIYFLRQPLLPRETQL